MMDNYNNRYIDLSVDENGKMTKIRISDTGEGISENNLKYIFNYGFTTKDSGGLGLSIVKDICERNNWRISLSSDEMTTFELFIPAVYLKDFSENLKRIR